MGHFLHLAWTDTSRLDLAETLVARAQAHGFAPVQALDQAWVGVRGPRPPRVHRPAGDHLLVLGDLFDALDGDRRPIPTLGEDADRARALVRRYWGRYVALFRTPRGQVRQILRDPSGAHECVAWRREGVQIVTSELSDWLMALAAPPIQIDWDRVGGLLRDPINATAASPLVGIRVAEAGDLTDLNARRVTPVWRPVDFTGSITSDPREGASLLRQRIDGCLAAFAQAVARPGVEVSGGLDSAIVAGAFRAAGAGPRLWFNMYGPFAEGDERRFVRTLGDRLGFEPHCVQRAVQPMTEDGFQITAKGPRPGVNGRDYAFDAAVASACREHGVDGLLTGKGGDGVFFQMGVPEIFTDVLRERGLRAVFSPALPKLARWTRRSTWALLKTALTTPRRAPLDRSARALSIFNPDSVGPFDADEALHPWLRNLETVPPAKRLQVESVAAGLAYQSQCRRTEAADLIHPLLAQPVVELALGLSVPMLTDDGEADRRLARAAFADRLPPEILHRRSKGEMTAYFGRQAAASLPFLRAHLLDGRLASRGIIDRGRTEALLDVDRLLWKGSVPDFTMAAVTESWVRRWEAIGAAA
ncbi:MAG: hypothetical protein DI531_09755 [Brevundimonas sp.]|jgi:asparagine synthase (glutamine-hydrolysing)|uniref:asparagine synthase-related protein n=1 Tax=Brevundimonas TaxID=41275 RepID=UPI000DB7E9D9|nr:MULTISPECIES: asparagine synthase C-terminal domain-containing protein [Brevundimonas]MBC1183286.1 asparagine synthase [Brevundimonas huaxiensis]PZU73821.1 MAG: hypothetical protein DI531_09755 [Brevundimonas sp.]